jgi:hypothetical protein
MRTLSMNAFWIRWLAAAFVSALLLAAPVSAESEEVEGGGEGEGFERENVLSFIVGGTSDDDEDAFTVGLDFEHRVNRYLGVGAVVEYATDDIDSVAMIGVLDIHLWRGLAIQTGPGVEFVGEEEEEDGATTSVNRREFLYRVGMVYEFEIGKLLVIPQVHYDYTSGKDSVVYATAFGFKF